MIKTCRRCERTLPIEFFHKNKDSPGGLASQCRICRAIKDLCRNDKAFIARYPTLSNRITLAHEVHGVLEQQQGVCAACRMPYQHRWALDHDHETGFFRGIICNHCNRMIGAAEEQLQRLEGGAVYLRKQKLRLRELAGLPHPEYNEYV